MQFIRVLCLFIFLSFSFSSLAEEETSTSFKEILKIESPIEIKRLERRTEKSMANPRFALAKLTPIPPFFWLVNV